MREVTKEKDEIREDSPDNEFLCNKYIGFSDMYKGWGGGWCLEVFLAHKKGIEDSSTHNWARKVRKKFNEHFLENNVNGSLYFSMGDWVELVEDVLTKGG